MCAYFQQATIVNTVGAAFNISLLWIEVSLNGRMSILKNVQQTRIVLISVITLLYVWLLCFLVFGASKMTQVVDVFSIVSLGISFFLGSNRIAKLLVLGMEADAELPEEIQRQHEQAAEITRILKNARAICVLCALLIISILLNLCSSVHKTAWLGFSGFTGAKLAILCIQISVLWHLDGGSVCSCCPKFSPFNNNKLTRIKKGRKIYLSPDAENGKKDEAEVLTSPMAMQTHFQEQTNPMPAT